MQEDIGLRSVTDGEFRRASWHMDFIYEIAGVQQGRAGHEERVPQRGRGHRVHAVRDPGHRQARDGPHDLRLRVRVRPRPRHDRDAEADHPAPSLVHYRGGPAAIDSSVYPDIAEFWADLGAAYAEEVRRLGASAAPTCSSTTPAWPTSTTRPSGPSSPGAARTPTTSTRPTSGRSTGRCATSRPRWRSPRTCAAATSAPRGSASGGYDFVADALFNQLNVDGFFMEFDDERSGGFAPLRFVPKGKYVVLGLVTSKRGELEAKDDIKRRIDEAAKHVRPGPAVPVAAVRLLLHARRQRADQGAADRQAAPRGGGRARRVGSLALGRAGSSRARTSRWVTAASAWRRRPAAVSTTKMPRRSLSQAHRSTRAFLTRRSTSRDSALWLRCTDSARSCARRSPSGTRPAGRAPRTR